MNQKKLKLICAALSLLCAAAICVAVLGQVKLAKLEDKIALLESEQAFFPTSSVADPELVVAEFNGGTVTAGEAAEMYDTSAFYYEMMGMDEADYAYNAKLDVLESLVEQKVLENKAKELGVFEMSGDDLRTIEANAQRDYEDNIAHYMDFRYDPSKSEDEMRADTIAYLNDSGLSYEDMLEQYKREAWQQKLYAAATKDVSVDEDALLELYETQLESAQMRYMANYVEYEEDAEAGRAMVWNPEGVRRIQLLEINFEGEQAIEYLTRSADGSALDELYASLEPAANALIERLNAGESFEKLMQEQGALNTDGIVVSTKSTLLSEALCEAAMAMQTIGEISAPIRTDGGLCILRYAADVPAGAVPFEEIKDALRPIYEEELKSSAFNASVMQWLEQADPKYYPELM